MRIEHSTLARLVLVPFATIAAFFLITEHRAHAFGALHYVLLALCPLLLYLVAWREESATTDSAPPTIHKHQDPH